MKKYFHFLTLFLFIAILLLVLPVKTYAFSLGGLFNDVKNFLSGNKSELQLTSKISLTPQGDLNANGQVDAGDVVTYSYIITNQTKNTYQFTTLKTNLDTKKINSINNVKGTLNLNTTDNTITVSNLTFTPNQVRTISFDARANFDKESDQTLSTEAELVDDQNKSLVKGQKQTVTAKKMDLERFNKFVHITK